MADTPAPPAVAPTHSLIDLPADAANMPRSVLLPLLRADLLWRWRHGQRVPVEAYLDLVPRLRDDVEALLDLVGSEILVREELGESTDLAAYRQRFPTLASLGPR